MTGRADRPWLWVRVFGAPIVFAALSLTGLLSALLFGDFGRYLSWITLALPVLVCIRGWLRLRRR